MLTARGRVVPKSGKWGDIPSLSSGMWGSERGEHRGILKERKRGGRS